MNVIVPTWGRNDNRQGDSMLTKVPLLIIMIMIAATADIYAEESRSTVRDVYEVVLTAYETVKKDHATSFPAFNDPNGRFVRRDTYVFIIQCPDKMMAHPFEFQRLKNARLSSSLPFISDICRAGDQPGGAWIEYAWPKPGEMQPSRKISYSIRVKGTPYTLAAGIYSQTADVADLNQTLR